MGFLKPDIKTIIEENLLIVNKDQKEVPFLFNKAQNHFFENCTGRNVILKARKMGFSSVLLAAGVAKFIYGRNERIVSMSFDKDASSKQLERAKRFLDSYQKTNNIDIKFKYNTKHEMVLDVKLEDGTNYTNTLRVGTAKSTGFGRGDDITFLHLTEVSLADHLDQLLAGVGEAVVNNAMITLETTANGYNGFKTFWDEAAAGLRNYSAFFYSPEWEYDKQFLDDRRAELGKLFDQEYPMTPEIAFLTSGELYFDNNSLKWYLERAKDPKKEDGFRKYRDFEKGEFVLIFADTAWGGQDACAAQFLSYQKLDVPLVYHRKTIASEMTPELHRMAEAICDATGIPPVLCLERNNGGVAELERLKRLNRNGKYILYREKVRTGFKSNEVEGAKLGFTTSSASRPTLLGMLKDAIDNKLINIYDRPTINEAFSFVEKQGLNGAWKAQAEVGAHDDLLMSLGGVWQMYQTERPPRTNRPPKKAKAYDATTGRVLS